MQDKTEMVTWKSHCTTALQIIEHGEIKVELAPNKQDIQDTKNIVEICNS